MKQIVDELRKTPEQWVDAAIVIVFDDRFEFVGEGHPDPMTRLSFLVEQGGIPIGFAGLLPTARDGVGVLKTQVSQDYLSQGWAHQYMKSLSSMVRNHSLFPGPIVLDRGANC
jgi:hypothetical protein